MRKSELIERLQAIDGDPIVLMVLDGKLSGDVSLSVHTANEEMISDIDPRTPLDARPAPGDRVVLI